MTVRYRVIIIATGMQVHVDILVTPYVLQIFLEMKHIIYLVAVSGYRSFLLGLLDKKCLFLVKFE